MFMLYLDLDELPTVFNRFWFWSLDKLNLANFKTSDYLCDNRRDIKASVLDTVEAQCGVRPAGPVRLLTHLRYFGYCFNPVSFYYCFNATGEQVEFIVAQINNTPWDERFCYVLDNRQGDDQRVAAQFDKAFHVSPFLPMDMQYDWRFSKPAKKLSVYMQNFQADRKVFDTTLLLKAKPINAFNLAKALIRFPFMTWQIVWGIYWQALRLWLKKIPFYTNPKVAEVSNRPANQDS